jgi:hypothetical protein
MLCSGLGVSVMSDDLSLVLDLDFHNLSPESDDLLFAIPRGFLRRGCFQDLVAAICRSRLPSH